MHCWSKLVRDCCAGGHPSIPPGTTAMSLMFLQRCLDTMYVPLFFASSRLALVSSIRSMVQIPAFHANCAASHPCSVAGIEWRRSSLSLSLLVRGQASRSLRCLSGVLVSKHCGPSRGRPRLGRSAGSAPARAAAAAAADAIIATESTHAAVAHYTRRCGRPRG